MYKLKEEASLLFDILWAMDGNDSLRRFIRRSAPVDGDSSIPGPSCERTDTRHVTGDMYISRDDVNKWAREAVARAKAPREGVNFISVLSSINLADGNHAGS